MNTVKYFKCYNLTDSIEQLKEKEIMYFQQTT